MTWQAVFAVVLGLLIGSFVNVLVYRLPRMILAEPNTTSDEPARYNLSWPASHCPHCKTPLRLWHNLPVLSYLWLKGRCGFCQHPISVRYPALEISTALLWLACEQRWGFNTSGLSWAIFASLLLALAVIDWKTQLLPDDLTQALVWAGLMASALGWIDTPLTQAVWGAVCGYATLWTVATVFERLTGKQGMGQGDFKLLAGLGAWLGPLALIPLLMAASLSGSVLGLALKWRGKLGADGYLPFGPFLACAGLGVAMIGMPTLSACLGW